MHTSIWECSSFVPLHKHKHTALLDGKITDACSSSLLKRGTSMHKCTNTHDCMNPLCRYCCQINFRCWPTMGSLREPTARWVWGRDIGFHYWGLRSLNLQHVWHSGAMSVTARHNGAHAPLWALPLSCALCTARHGVRQVSLTLTKMKNRISG